MSARLVGITVFLAHGSNKSLCRRVGIECGVADAMRMRDWLSCLLAILCRLVDRIDGALQCLFRASSLTRAHLR